MKLIVNITNKPCIKIIYNGKYVSVCVNNEKDILDFINNKTYRKENLALIKSKISMIDNSVVGDDITDDIMALKYLESINKELTYSDFNGVTIDFSEDFDVNKFKTLFENADGEIKINTSGLSNKNILNLQNINFKSEPKIKSVYNLISFATLKETIDTVKKVEEIKDQILKYDFSQLEQLMFLYDLLKERIYKKNDDLDSADCRDLTRVINGENIVCAGFSNLFSAVANALNIKTVFKRYDMPSPNGGGHSDNVCYINDLRYNFHGPLEFDVTWDSKRNKKDTRYVDNYFWFGNPVIASEKLKKKVFLTPSMASFYELEKRMESYESLEQTSIKEKLLPHMAVKIFNIMLDYLSIINDETGLMMLSTIEDKIVNRELISSNTFRIIFDYLKANAKYEIKNEDFIRIFYRVRRVEHSIDPKKYYFDEKSINKVMSERINKANYFLQKTLNFIDENKIVHTEEYMKNIKIGTNKIPYDMKRMELIYALNKGINK